MNLKERILILMEGNTLVHGQQINERALVNQQTLKKGKIFNKEGKEEYSGSWSQDKMDGQGIVDYVVKKGKRTYDDGAVYEGEWRNDNREGRGKCLESNSKVA